MSKEINNLYEFAEFRFDGKKGKLWKNNELILLAPKASALLELLLKSNGEYVSKEEIFEKVWADTFVEDGVLTQNIYTLRKILGNDAIENKTRLGYRITVPIIQEEEKRRRGEGEIVKNSSVSQTQLAPVLSSNSRRVTLLIIASIILLIIPTIGYIFRSRIAAFFRKPIESVKFTKLTDTGNLSNAAFSPDGNFLAFVRGDKIFLKDVVSSKEIPLDIPNVSAFGSLQFSADGNFLYFRNNTAPFSSSKILRTSRFGGDMQVIAEKSIASFSLSPDNKFLAYYSFRLPEMTVQLLIKNLETKEEKQITEPIAAGALCRTCAPAWSPDGKKIIHVNQVMGSQIGRLDVIDVETGKPEVINLPRLRNFEQAAWFPDGKSFVISASADGRFFHLWKVFYPDGEVQALTVGLSSYNKPIISADGKKIMALQSIENSNLFTAESSNLNEQKQITTGNSNRFGQISLTWADNERIIYSSQPEGELSENLWLTDVDGRAKKQVTNESGFAANAPSTDGKFIYYNINRNRVANISRVSINGENLTEITNESDGSRRSPQITADGNWLYYVFYNPTGSKIMRRNLAEQKEEIFIENENLRCGFILMLSPDEKYLACRNWASQTFDAEKYNAEIAVFSTENKADVRFLQINYNPTPLGFSPDSQAIEFISNFGEGTQIMRLGLGETDAKPILQMPKDYIFNFAWSKDGKKLALSRGQQYRDAVLLSEFDK